jgi:hypothetical protein
VKITSPDEKKSRFALIFWYIWASESFLACFGVMKRNVLFFSREILIEEESYV